MTKRKSSARYYCNKCRHYHNLNSAAGHAHQKYQRGKGKKKYVTVFPRY